MKLIPLIPRERYRTEMSTNFRRYDNHTKLNELDLPKMEFSQDHGTPAFLTLYDKKNLKNDPKYFEKCLKRRFENLERSDFKISLNLPKVQKKSSAYCGVCECKYDCDYYKHISSSFHKEKFKNHQLFEALNREALVMNEEFEKNKREYIRKAALETQDKKSNQKDNLENTKKREEDEEKENRPSGNNNKQSKSSLLKFNSYYLDDLFTRKIDRGTAKKETEQTNKTTKKKVLIQRFRFSETGTLITEYEDGSYSKSPEGRILFLSQQSRFSHPQPEENKFNEGSKQKQLNYSNQMTGFTSCERLSFDKVRLTPLSINKERTPPRAVEQSQDSLSGKPLKRNLKRNYSMYSDSERELLKKFKSVKITEYNQTQSQSQTLSHSQRNETSSIKIDLQTISKTKWENFKKSFNGFLGELKGKVNQFYDFWRRKEPSN